MSEKFSLEFSPSSNEHEFQIHNWLFILLRRLRSETWKMFIVQSSVDPIRFSYVSTGKAHFYSVVTRATCWLLLGALSEKTELKEKLGFPDFKLMIMFNSLFLNS